MEEIENEGLSREEVLEKVKNGIYALSMALLENRQQKFLIQF